MKVVFDFDGTICDSMPQLEEVGVKLIEVNYETTKRKATEWYRDTIGLSFHEQLSELFPGSEYLNRQVAQEFVRLQEEVYKHVHVFDDVYEAFELLKREKVTIGICSSSYASLTWNVIQRKFQGYGFIVTGREYGSKSDQLQLYFKNDQLGYFIGDALRDGMIADLLNIHFIGVRHTFTDDDFFREKLWSVDNVLAAVETALELRGAESIEQLTLRASPSLSEPSGSLDAA